MKRSVAFMSPDAWPEGIGRRRPSMTVRFTPVLREAVKASLQARRPCRAFAPPSPGRRAGGLPACLRHGSPRRIRRESPALPANINRLFTAKGKKSVCGLRTGPASVCRSRAPVSRESITGSLRLHLDLGVRMKFGVPWSVKGIRPEARETAREAARRSGMPLGEWLNSVILQQATPMTTRVSYGDDMSSVHERLDDITRRLEQFTRSAPAAQARPTTAAPSARPQRRPDRAADRAPRPAHRPIGPIAAASRNTRRSIKSRA